MQLAMDTADINFRYSHPIQIRLSDLDPLGHVNNGVQFFYYDLGRIHYLEAIQGVPISWTEIDLVVVHTACDFIRSIRYKEHIAVQTKITEIGNKSLRMVQRIINTDNGEVKSTCYTVLSGFDRAHDCSQPISMEYKRKIMDYEHNEPILKTP